MCIGLRYSIVGMLAACLVCCNRDEAAPRKVPTRAPFTRESVLAEQRLRGASVALPPDAPARPLRSSENVVYRRVGDLSLALDVYAPIERGPHPALLVVHGGGWERGERFMERPLARHLAARGYVAVPVQYRLGEAGRFPAALHDLKAAVRWLREHADSYDVDAAHIAAIGGSAGGQLVALLGASNGEAALEGGFANVASKVQAVVCIDGLADFEGRALLDKERANPGAPTRFLGGPHDARANVWREASPLAHVRSDSAPTLFINSTAQSPILPGRAEMCARLKAQGVPCEIVVLDGAPHPFWLLEPWFSPALEHIDHFLRARFGKAP